PNPFAADQQQPTQNPFAADQQQPTQNPFAADQQEPTRNPFEADQQDPTPNPFATGNQRATGTVRSAQGGTSNQSQQGLTGNQNQRLTGSQRGLSGVGPGDVLADKYLIEAALGKGGMAVVWRGRHLLMDRPVAIKMMLPEVMEEEDSLQRFLREMKAASSLKHPNIVTIYDFDQTPVPYIVMDLLNGRSLDVILEEEGKLQPARIVHILSQMCDALAVAHHANMIHRDIKPSNIVIENRVMQPDFVQLVDFGIAKLVDSNSASMKLTKTGEIFGSILYMSPEQCMGKPLDARSDIYALGCVIFELLTGELPFAGSSVYQTLSNHVNGEPPCLSDLCPEVPNADQFQEVFMKAVQKAPNLRYQTTMELKKDLLKLQ
ncbi:MAG TPA: serine/threonine-protein kinase, partial [Trichormus sp.]